MIQYQQLSLFEIMPDPVIDSKIENLPCRVVVRRQKIHKPRLSYFHWRITNIYDYVDYPLDCTDGEYDKTGYTLRLYLKGWGVYIGAMQKVSPRSVFAMLAWLHEKQANPRRDLYKSKEVENDPNRSYHPCL